MADAPAPEARPSLPPGRTPRPNPAAPAPAAPHPPDEPPPRRVRWLTPGGLSAIAAIAGCVIALASLILTNVIDLRPGTRAAPTPGSSAAPPANLLFVYGTTKPGEPRHAAIAHYVADSYDDSVTGYLYDSGVGYPAAKFGPGEPIAGTVLIIHEESAEQFFAEMTRLESGLFALRQVRTLQRKQLVGAYEWIGPTDGLERIDRWPR